MKTMKTIKPQSTRLIAAPAIAGLILLANASAQTPLVDENWQSPLLTNGTEYLTTEFSGWTFSTGDQSGAVSRRRDATGDLPGDSTVTAPNQAIELNGDNTYGEINIAHNWAATDVYYLRIEASPADWGGANQRWIRPELRQQDDTVLWSTAEDATTAVPLYGSYMGALTDYPSELTFFFKIDASTFTAGAEGQPLRLRLDGSGQRSLYINNVSLVLGPLPADTTAPTPDPLTWDIVPTVSNFKDISMRIGSARDGGDLYGVEYYFENTVRGTNSGWQNSREWAETGLNFNTEYTYRVKARDKSPTPNASTTWSSEESVTTLPQDLTPPSPDPLTWETVPTVADYRSITMAVNEATDPSGVEYYFENVTKSTNSGWIASPKWTEKELDPEHELHLPGQGPRQVARLRMCRSTGQRKKVRPRRQNQPERCSSPASRIR